MNFLVISLRIMLTLGVLVFGYLGFSEYQDQVCGTCLQTGEDELCEKCQRMHPPEGEGPVIHSDQPIFRTLKLLSLGAGETDHHDNLYLFFARICAMCLALIITKDFIEKFYQEFVLDFRLIFVWKQTLIIGLGKIGTDVAIRNLTRRTDYFSSYFWLDGKAWRDYFLGGTVIIEDKYQTPTVIEVSRLGGIILQGDGRLKETLQRAKFHRASMIHILAGSDEVNLEILSVIAQLLTKQPQHITCLLHIQDLSRAKTYLKLIESRVENSGLKTHFYNYTQSAAEQLVISELTLHRPKKVDEVALYIIYGFDNAGQAVANEIARLAHFENLKRSRVLVIDKHPQEAAEKFHMLYSRFSRCIVETDYEKVKFDAKYDEWDYKDETNSTWIENRKIPVDFVCNAIFISMPHQPQAPAFTQMLCRLCQEDKVKPIIIIAQSNPLDNILLTTTMNETLPYKTYKVPFYAWVPNQSTHAELVKCFYEDDDSTNSSTNQHISFFGEYQTVNDKRIIEKQITNQIARVIHYDYLLHNQQISKFSSQELSEFDELPISLIDSNKRSAVHYAIKIKIAGFRYLPPTQVEQLQLSSNKNYERFEGFKHYQLGDKDIPQELEILGNVEHNRWMGNQLMDGYFYGANKDIPPKARPSMIPWSEGQLPESERIKDINQIYTVFAALNQQEYIKGELLPLSRNDETSKQPKISGNRYLYRVTNKNKL